MSGERVYLAEPDVFYPDALKHAAWLKETCAKEGLVGVFPLDAQIARVAGEPGPAFARRIFDANIGLIRASRGMLANITPFRGPSADVGTAWEMGYARALNLPIVGYSLDPNPKAYCDRVKPDGMLVEDFMLDDNLMIACGADDLCAGVAQAAKKLARLLTTACKHEFPRGGGLDTEWRCTKCGVKLCTDCGSEPVWWYAWNEKCRHCALRGGQPSFVRDVNPDAVLRHFDGNEDAARRFLEEVQRA